MKIHLLVFLFMAMRMLPQANCYNAFLNALSEQEKKDAMALEIETKLVSNKVLSASSGTFIIPVVFHIFHNGGASDIPVNKILNQLTILNKEFQRQHADTVLTPAGFKPFAAGLNIEFRLATKDPAGNCTNGINRIYTTQFECSNVDSVMNIIGWPSNQYLNIWVGETFKLNNPLGNSNGMCYDIGIGTWPWIQFMRQGIILTSPTIYNIGVASYKGRTIIHEAGHFLNLRHIWGDAVCGNDSVADTPPQNAATLNCPSFPKNPLSPCGTGTLGEMYCNYMDYSPENCKNMFTAGQVSRMTACLNSTVGARNNLWSPSNLIATGTADPYIYPAPCIAEPAIRPFAPVIICAGDSVKMTDVSYGGSKTSRLWNFYGNPASSLTDSIVWVKYQAAGEYNVELTITLNAGSKNKIFNKRVIVLDPMNTSEIPYLNGFESQLEKTEWKRINADNDTTWRVFNNVAYTGNSSMGISNFYNDYPLVDNMISPSFNLSAYEKVVIKFKVHFTRREINTDNLSVFYTTNCGKNWGSAYSKTGNALQTSTVTNTNYHIPVTTAEWREDSVIVQCDPSFTSTRFKIEFKSGYGNNIFIDDINIQGRGDVSLKEFSPLSSVLIFPNPASSVINLRFDTPLNSDKLFELTNVSGILVHKSYTGKNKKEIQLDLQDIPSGLYILRMIEDDGAMVCKKIVIQR